MTLTSSSFGASMGLGFCACKGLNCVGIDGPMRMIPFNRFGSQGNSPEQT